MIFGGNILNIHFKAKLIWLKRVGRLQQGNCFSSVSIAIAKK